jgi:glycosyltransferase 2 family protein
VKGRAWTWAGGAAILLILFWRVGAGPFIHGIREINGWSLLAAVVITALTTVAAAWRWKVVGDALGVGLPLHTAVAAYYRSQFLNSALPGGILGDVHRGVSHGRAAQDVSHGLRAVAWERTAGQVVQTAVALIVLFLLPSPVRSWLPISSAVIIGTVAAAVVVIHAVVPHGSSRPARIVRAIRADVRAGLIDRRAWPAVTVASLVVVAGHLSIFVIAARTAGVTTSTASLIPLAVLVLLATTLPLSIGGWGPREGVAAWAFAAAGLGAGQGVAAATAYGVMAFAATLPGAVVLIIRWRRDDRAVPSEVARVPSAVHG